MNETLDIPRGFTGCLSKAGLGIAGTADRVKITAPNGAGIDYAIDGIAYHAADADNIDTGAAAVQAALTTCIYLLLLDSGGTLTTVKGTEQLNADLAAGTRVLHWPQPTADTCPIGAVKVKCENAATFTLGTTNFSASDVTDTYYDFGGGMPTAPLAS
ncbi:MAG: hypothetical protein A3E01_08240 [Gammaproteobacteria bacterium RIFCSPHIGHO2_12_FULL_63_22]|nr:MAG: hypothetical protein A3E01_08240 [Gammaproteobacteria bacterium RIFCSPHIGHO2_12_FULL_63_22]